MNTLITRLGLNVVLAFLLQLSGCTYHMASYEDVSDEAPFSKIIGLEITTKRELLIYGYSLSSIPGKEIDEYVIRSQPLAKTRFILSREEVPAESVFSVTSVKRCTNCWFDQTNRLKIEIKPEFEQQLRVPIVVDDSLLIENWNGESRPTFSTSYFEPVTTPP